MVFTAGKWWCMSQIVKTCKVINKWCFGKQSMALMGTHYFHEAPQLSHSQGCRLIELDEWTVIRTKQEDPTTTQTKTPADSNSQMPVNTQICTLSHTGWCTYTPSSKESVYSCKVKHGKKRVQLSSRQMTWDVGGLIIFPVEGLKPCCCRLLTTSLLFCSPLFMVLSTLKEHLPPQCLDVGVKMSAGVHSRERWDDSYRKRET